VSKLPSDVLIYLSAPLVETKKVSSKKSQNPLRKCKKQMPDGKIDIKDIGKFCRSSAKFTELSRENIRKNT
jgi:hypothetical protein